MKSIVPYTKEIQFESKLAEICSISLEHEMSINDSEIEGNFIVTGEYKSHEVSVNKESFSYKLPFSVDVTDNIIKESIDFEITDFTYDIVNEDTLRVDIEFSVTAMEEEKLENNRDAIIEEINELFLEEDGVIEDEINKEEEVVDEDSRLDQESANLILNSASDKDDEYTTYFIHLVKPGDTIESIVATYKTDVSIIKKYNTIESINVGDKIIIPSIDE